MAMKLDAVVPFGRSLDEYTYMFNLTSSDLAQRILGVADGPASFNAEASLQGATITSIDPIYTFSGRKIQQRFNAVLDGIIDQVRATPRDWVWTYHKSPDDLKQNREVAMRLFLADYEEGKKAGRYQVGSLPDLDFPDQSFDLALCSHFLFLYSAHYDADFHQHSIREILRVSREVRIFPLLTLMLERSPYLDAVIQMCQQEGYEVAIVPTAYELQKGGHEMLKICRVDSSSCFTHH